MADALPINQRLRTEYPVAAKDYEDVSGITMAPSQDLRIFADTGGSDIAFVAAVLEKDTSTGQITEKNYGCNTANVSWTNLYSTPAGKSAYVRLTVHNAGDTGGQFSCGVTVTEVVGETGGGGGS